jgi:hemolysin D
MVEREPDLPFLGGLLGRYGTIFRHAWANRRENDAQVRLPHELAFLPANLELAETPVHPAPLWAARLIMGAALVVTLIAAFGQLDIVAIAPGELIPNANVKVIQPVVTAVVREILVHNGERVTGGQLLVDLDSTQASADAEDAKSTKIDAQLTVARAQALLTAQAENSDPQVAPIPGVTVGRQRDAQRLALGAFREYRDQVSALKAELERREAQLETTREEISKLEQTAPLARRQADDYQELVKGRFVASHEYEYMDKERAAIDQTYELAAEKSRARELAAGVEEGRRNIEAAIATFQREQLEALNKAEEKVAQSQDEETKADARRGLMQLKSPVVGVVQHLNVHTIGGVVTSAQPVMEIVPDDTLEVEARVSNKDIGFVNPGQNAIVKIATFPYTRYGYLTGTVIKVSNDASPDRKLGLVYLARIRIPSNRFRVEGKWLNLSAGMEVTAEIKTGTQKVWQYFLGPLIDTARESLRER